MLVIGTKIKLKRLRLHSFLDLNILAMFLQNPFRDQSEFKLEGGGGGGEMKFFRTKFGTPLKSEKIFEGPPLPSVVGIFQNLSLA